MTVQEYISLTPADVRRELDPIMEIWNKKACYGYCVEAMYRSGLSPAAAAGVVAELRELFDSMNVDAARHLWEGLKVEN